MGLAFTSFVDNLYSQTWTRAPPYFIGIMAGWLLHRFSKTKLKLPNVSLQYLFSDVSIETDSNNHSAVSYT